MDHVFAAPRLQGCSQEGRTVRFDRAGGILFYPIQGSDLNGYAYLLADVENKADYAVCLNIGFWEEHTDKRSDLYLSVGILPGIAATVSVPLDYLNGQTLFGKRRPGILKTVVKGNRINPQRLAAMAFSLPASHSETALVIGNVRLSRREPELGDNFSSLLDGLGQYAGKAWPGKTGSREESKQYLTSLLEEARQFLSTHEDGYYGAPEITFAATGYFRVERTADGCCWLVTPDGRGFFSSGIDCVAPHAAGPVGGKDGVRDTIRLVARTVLFQSSGRRRPRRSPAACGGDAPAPAPPPALRS